MNAYLFSAAVTQSQLRPASSRYGQTVNTLQTWDSCLSLVVCADDPEAGQREFEAWLNHTSEGEHPVQSAINRLVAAQFVETLLTESGPELIDWASVSERIEPTLHAAEDDELDHGYWADANRLVRPGKLSSDIESLPGDLPEDVRSGLNWQADRQFFFIVSVLTPPSLPAFQNDEAQASTPPDHGDAKTDGLDSDGMEPDDEAPAIPELADKETVALVQARNAAVAAWLWRRFAADTPYAGHDIDIEPWCGLIGMGPEQPGGED